MSDTPPSPRTPMLILAAVFAGLLVLSVPMVGIVAAIAIPNYVMMQLKAKRAEVPGNVDGIKTALLAYDAAFDGFVPAGTRAEAEAALRSGGKEPRAWTGGPGWEALGWRPEGPIRGAYWVEVAADGQDFIVYGLCDVDGDGDFAEYTATSRGNATLMNGPNVY